MSLHSHPIRLLSEANLLGHYTPAAQLDTITHKSVIKVVGLVKGRQSPGTASGVTFITLEDDTGNSNVIVWQATARAQKQAYLKAQILKVSGILERGDGGVTHIIAGRLEDLSHLIDELAIHSRDFH
jgi:error-prone DNA polymerase